MTPALEAGQTVRVRNGGTKDGYLVTVLEVHDDPNRSVTVTWWDTFHDEQRTGAFFADELEPVDPALIPAVLAAADGALARDEHGKVRAGLPRPVRPSRRDPHHHRRSMTMTTTDEQHVHIPASAPEIAAFQRLIDANPETVYEIGDSDPDQATPCPAWCAGGHTVMDRLADKVHRSDSVVLPQRANPAVSGTRVFLPHVTIRLEQTHTTGAFKPRLILAARRRPHGKPGAVWTEDTVFSGGAAAARRLRDALDVAIRAMDPDGEFDAAAPVDPA